VLARVDNEFGSCGILTVRYVDTERTLIKH
jgi:hypothetical protein